MKDLALITGSSRGIGRGVAEALSKKYVSIITGRNSKDVDLCVEAIKKHGGEALSYVGDLTVEAELESCFNWIDSLDENLSLVVANLGSGKSQAGWQVGLEEFQRVFSLNFFSTVMLCEKSLKRMTRGQIIAISSIAGVEVLGAPIAYNSAKAALIAYMKSLASLAAAQGVRINTVSPGNVMFEGSTWDTKIKDNREATLAYIEKNVPLNSFASPKDIAEAVCFLAESKFVNGHNLVVDGGQLKGW